MFKKSLVSISVFLFALSLGLTLGFHGTPWILAFDGPAGSAGTGTGAISSNSSNNLSIGTTTVLSDTRLFLLGSNSVTSSFAIQLKNLEGRPMFALRNNGQMSVGPFPIGSPPTSTATTLLVRGLIETVDSVNPNLGGGIRFPDGTTQTTAGAGTVSAANVSSGNFGSNTGGGNYTFPASLSVGTGVVNPVATGPGDIVGGTDLGSFQVDVSAGSQYIDRAIDSSAGVQVRGRRSRNTVAAPSTILSGDDLILLRAYGHDGSSYVESSRIQFDSEGTIGTNIVPGLLRFYTADSSGSLGQRFVVNSNGITLDATSQFLGLSGDSSSTPSFAWSGDPDTGVFRPTANTLALTTNGSEKFRVASDGLITVKNRITGVSTPTAASDAATKNYVDSNSGVVWAGYTTTTYPGSMAGAGGVKAANQICNSNYAGSHWANTSEIIRLGTNYPWSDIIWLAQLFGNASTDCNHWTSNSGSFTGTTADLSTVKSEERTCNQSLKLACVY